MLYGQPGLLLDKNGIPRRSTSACTMIRRDYVNGYDLINKMPMFVSFTLTSDVVSVAHYLDLKSSVWA